MEGKAYDMPPLHSISSLHVELVGLSRKPNVSTPPRIGHLVYTPTPHLRV